MADNQITEAQLFRNFRIPLTNNRLVPGVLASYGVGDRRALGRLLRSRVTGRNNLLALPQGIARNDIQITRRPVNSLTLHEQARVIQRRMRGVREANIRRQRAQALSRGQANLQKRKRDAERSVTVKRARRDAAPALQRVIRKRQRVTRDAVMPLQRVVRRRLGVRRDAARPIQRAVRRSQQPRLVFGGTQRTGWQFHFIEQKWYLKGARYLDVSTELGPMILGRVRAARASLGRLARVIVVDTDGRATSTGFFQRGSNRLRSELNELIWNLNQSNDKVVIDYISIQYQSIPDGGSLPVPDPFVESKPKGLHAIINNDDLCGQRVLATSMLTPDHYRKHNQGKRSIKRELKKVIEIMGNKRLRFDEFDAWGQRVVVLTPELKVEYDSEKPSAPEDIVYVLHCWTTKHYHYIRYINQFVNNHINTKNGNRFTWCHSCLKKIRCEHFEHHKCGSGLKCGQCSTVFATPEEKAVHDEVDLTTWGWPRCPDCNKMMHSPACYDAHVGNCKGKKWKCGCNQWIDKSRLSVHVCDEQKCEICETYYTGEHRCFVQPYKEKKVDKVGKVYAYDFESRFEDTIVNGGDPASRHVVNLAVVMDIDEYDKPEYKPLTFRTIEACINWMCEQKMCTFVAHNGKAYDMWLIHQSIMKRRPDTPPKNLVLAGNKIMYMTMGSVRFIDSLNHFGCALAKLPEMYEFDKEIKKGIYPYNFNTLENESYVGVMPDKKYFEPHRMMPKAASEFHDWYNKRVVEDNVWNNWKELEEYCVDDVKILARALRLYRQTAIDDSGLDPMAFVTIASYCMAVYKHKHLEKDSICVLQKNEFDFIKKGFCGGRTNAIKLHKEWTEEDFAAGIYGMYQDVVSLYPTVQFYDVLPAGVCAWVTENLESLLNEKYDKDGGIGYYEVDVVCPKDLFLPVLPEKKDGKLIFDLHDKFNYVGTSIELKKALELGYTITKYHRALVFEKARDDLFKSYVRDCLKTKVENSTPPPPEGVDKFVADYKERFDISLDKSKMKKNEGMRALSKLKANNLWGKFGQDPEKSVNEYVTSPAVHFKYLRQLQKGEIKDYKVTLITANCVMAEYMQCKSEKTCLKDTNLGLAAFVTAHARLRLYSELEKLGDRVLYFDTDSIIFEYREGEYNIPEGTFLGEWESETRDKKTGRLRIITHFVSLGPKSYSYKIENDEGHTKNKGFTLNVDNSKAVNYQKMKDLVQGKVNVLHTQNLNFKKQCGAIYSHTLCKDQVFGYNKRAIVNRYDTLPFGHSAISAN